MTAALRRSRTIRPWLARLISATVLSQTGCTILDETPAPTCMDPSPECQALCAQDTIWPEPIGCERTTPRQVQFRAILITRRCNQWRELLQPVSGINLKIKPQDVGITPTRKEPCYF